MIALALAAWLASDAAPVPTDGARDLAIVGVNVLTIEPRATLLDHTVIVRDGRVAILGPSKDVVPSESAEIVDGHGRWLMPGLVDALAQLEDSGELPLHLAHGVTCVRVQPGRTALLDLRDQIARGERIGPRLLVDSPRIDRGDPARMEAVVERIRAAGYDGIMVGRRLPAETARELSGRARAIGLRVGGELSREMGREGGLPLLDTLTGVEFLLDAPLPPPPETVPKIERPTWIERGFGRETSFAERTRAIRRVVDSRVTVVPMLAAFEGLVPQVENRAEMLLDPKVQLIVPPFRLLWGFHGHGLRRFVPVDAIDEAQECARLQRGLLADLDEAHARIIAGSGAMLDFVWPGEGLVRELEAWCAAGLDPERALRGATVDAAQALSIEGGILRVGARADLLLLERDPRVDVKRLRGVLGVVVGGRWLSADAIEAERRARAACYEMEVADNNALIKKDVRPALEKLLARGGGLFARDEGWQRLAELMVDVDRARDAEYMARATIERTPDAWWGHWVLARAMRRLKEMDPAIAAARRALELRPTAIEPWLLLEDLGLNAAEAAPANTGGER